MKSQLLKKAAGQARIGLAMFSEGNHRQGLRFFAEEFLINSGLRALAALPFTPRRVQCNVCGWQGARFLTHCAVDYVDRNAFCPRCLAYSRHRGFAWLCEHDADFKQALGSASDAQGLVFAPEPGMVELLARHRPRLFGMDIERRNHLVDVLADATALPLRDECLGFAFCFHVLEHIEHDVRALTEIGRCLRSDGVLVLCVPTAFDLAETICYGEANPRLNGHWYAYGLDFGQRIAASGLFGRSFRLEERIPAKERARLGIVEEELWLLTRRDVPAAGRPESEPPRSVGSLAGSPAGPQSGVR